MYVAITGICNNILSYFIRLFSRQLFILATTPLSTFCGKGKLGHRVFPYNPQHHGNVSFSLYCCLSQKCCFCQAALQSCGFFLFEHLIPSFHLHFGRLFFMSKLISYSVMTSQEPSAHWLCLCSNPQSISLHPPFSDGIKPSKKWNSPEKLLRYWCRPFCDSDCSRRSSSF